MNTGTQVALTATECMAIATGELKKKKLKQKRYCKTKKKVRLKRIPNPRLSVFHSPVLGVTRYLCNALRNIITFVVTK